MVEQGNAPAPVKKSHRGRWIVIAAVVVVVLAIASGSRDPDGTGSPSPTPSATPQQAVATPTVQPADPWTREAAVAYMEAQGFTGEESPLTDGTLRWLARDDASNMFEAIGDGNLRTVSLTSVANEENGVLLGRVLTIWLPDAQSWVSDQIASYAGTDLDVEETFRDGTAHIITITATDGILVIVTLDRAP